MRVSRASSGASASVYMGIPNASPGRPCAPTRLAVLLALYGQLAMLAHGALVGHVTCGADGELIHVRADGASPAPAHSAARAVVDAGSDEHDHCLLDEEGEAACPRTHVASGEPVLAARADHLVRRRLRAAFTPAPLYRLAPKNSPPA